MHVTASVSHGAVLPRVVQPACQTGIVVYGTWNLCLTREAGVPGNDGRGGHFCPGPVKITSEEAVKANHRGHGEKERTRFLFSGVEFCLLTLMTASAEWDESVGGGPGGEWL